MIRATKWYTENVIFLFYFVFSILSLLFLFFDYIECLASAYTEHVEQPANGFFMFYNFIIL